MTERITPAMVTATTLNNINSSLATLERTSDELSSGKAIHEPSDNPYGASQVIDLQSQLDGLSSYATNAQEGISWENTAGGAMANIVKRAADRARAAGAEARPAQTTRATAKASPPRWTS